MNILSIASISVVLMIPADHPDEGATLTIRAAQDQIYRRYCTLPYIFRFDHPFDPTLCCRAARSPYRAGAGCGLAGGATVLGFEKFTLGTARAPSEAAK